LTRPRPTVFLPGRKRAGFMRLRARIASLTVAAVGTGALTACGLTAAAQSPRPALIRDRDTCRDARRQWLD
jgi:hypothetical protein